MSAPSMTFNGEGDVRSSSSLAASATASYNLDFSTVFDAQVTVKNTPGGSVSTTRGVRVEFLPRYGTTPSDTTLPAISYDLPSAAASTAESKTFWLTTGKWVCKVTNLDASNAVTVEISSAVVGSVA